MICLSSLITRSDGKEKSADGLTTFFERLRDDLSLELFLKPHLLQAAVLFFELFNGDIHAAVLDPTFEKILLLMLLFLGDVHHKHSKERSNLMTKLISFKFDNIS